MFIKNKKGVSEIVSYTLLVIIAVGLSVLVYNFLLGYVPKDKVGQCPEGTSLIVQSIVCEQISGTATITELKLSNKGLWNIPFAYIRVGVVGAKVRSSLEPSPYPFEPVLAPGKTTEPFSLDVSPDIINYLSGTEYEIEVQPVIFSEETQKRIACTNSIITQPFSCPSTSPTAP
ncbi:MAG: hypothetical protein Q8L29_03245 [archaeon]|nr:hypothetical protein [archaeon]